MDEKVPGDILTALLRLHEKLDQLHQVLEQLPGRITAAITAVLTPPPAAESPVRAGRRAAWTLAAEAFLQSPAAQRLAAERKLTLEAIAVHIGLLQLNNGRRKQIGSLAKKAGLVGVRVGDGPVCYVPKGQVPGVAGQKA
jgi:hypothetical protein